MHHRRGSRVGRAGVISPHHQHAHRADNLLPIEIGPLLTYVMNDLLSKRALEPSTLQQHMEHATALHN